MCYFTLREEHRLRVCENKAWKKTFWCKRDKVMEIRRNCIMQSFMMCTAEQII
jgi:hypothetical protein